MERHLRPVRSSTAILCPSKSLITKLPLLLQKPSSSPRRFSSYTYPSSTQLSTSYPLRPAVLLAKPESQVSGGVNTDAREWAMQDFYFLRKDVETATIRVKEIRNSACLYKLEQEVADLELKAADTAFWDDRAQAQENLSALTDVQDRIKLLNEFKSQVEDVETIVKLTEEMDSIDHGLLEEA